MGKILKLLRIFSIYDFFFATDIERERKEIFEKYFDEDFEEFTTKTHYLLIPANDQEEVLRLVKEDIQHISQTIRYSSSTLKIISIGDLHIGGLGVGNKLWQQLVGECLNKTGYHLVVRKYKVQICFSFTEPFESRRKRRS